MHYLGSPRFQGGNRGNALSNCALIGWPPRSSLPHPSEVLSRPASHYSLNSLQARAVGLFFMRLFGLSSRSMGSVDRTLALDYAAVPADQNDAGFGCSPAL